MYRTNFQEGSKEMDDPSKTESHFSMETTSQVPDEAFNLFHSIDRELYARLIQTLGRDPAESVQVMAFWMWLEREGNDMTLIRRLLSLPPALLNEIADETAMCLKCVENDRFQSGDGNGNEIALLPDLLSNPAVGLRFFHENRIALLQGVTEIINTVCARAFYDILQRAWRGQAAADARSNVTAEGGGVQFVGAAHDIVESSGEAERRAEEGGDGPVPNVPVPFLYHPCLNVPFVPLPPSAAGGLVIRTPSPPQPPQHVLPPGAHRVEDTGIPIHMKAAASFPAYQMLTTNLSINTWQGTTGDDGAEEVPADDRTIFLTFSKGYPITEDELREFFTRRFGDFIEDLIMQEVGEDEQVLYARMVARSAAVIERIVGGSKAKYSINGKHVWARRYVKKQQQQQSRSSPPREGDSTSSSSQSKSTTEPGDRQS